jgi:CRP-like cAMP-binding protein
MLHHLFEAGLLLSATLHVAAGGFVFRRGQPSAEVYWLERGCVDVQTDDATRVTSRVLEAPVLLGAAHLLNATSSHTARALTDCELRVVSRAQLWEQVHAQPALRLYLLRCLSDETALTRPHFE